MENTPTQTAVLYPQQTVIFTLDNCHIHLDQVTEEPLYNKEYFFVVIGKDITVDIQCNETNYHKGCKAFYKDRNFVIFVIRK